MVRMEKVSGSTKRASSAPSRTGCTQNMAANIKVVVRVRPLSEREVLQNNRIVVDVVDDRMLVFDPKEEIRPFFYQGVQQPNKNFLKRANKELKFVFDQVCGQSATNKDVFELTTKEILTSLMEGYNCSVFVYGATGAGKTFTMIGSKENPGITYLTMEHLFYTINSFEKEREFDIGVSYIEVYNENVYDLLKPSNTPLQLREDTKYGVVVAGLTLNNIKTARELLNMLENGNKNRKQHPTDANAESSRSHAVFQVSNEDFVCVACWNLSQQVLSGQLPVDVRRVGHSRVCLRCGRSLAGQRVTHHLHTDTPRERAIYNVIAEWIIPRTVYVKMRYKTSSQLRLVKLSMIDLAGSERASATGCIGERFKEGANINKSLLSLGNCINKLADGNSYIPYRDSKLTRLLKDSLGGNCKTVMIANVSPSCVSFEDTYNTLKYAARANKIQLSIKKNIVDGDMRLSQLVKINEELKKKVKELEAKLSLSSVRQATKEPDASNVQLQQEWRRRVAAEAGRHGAAEGALLALVARQKVLALRHRLQTRAFRHVADLAHRSSSEAMDLMFTEDVPRQERAAENYLKQSVNLDSQIMSHWHKWDASRQQLAALCERAQAECPELADFIHNIQLQGDLRLIQARDQLRFKLLTIENDEINAFTEYMSDMPSMLKKLYLTLKGYDKAPPALTDEYLELMKKAKSAKAITWSDDDAVLDPHFKFVSSLSLEQPVANTIELPVVPAADDSSATTVDTVDVVTDSDDLTDLENHAPYKPLPKKRKGTPIKLANNETIIINDSFENLDTTRTMNSAKKIKKESLHHLQHIENYGALDAKDLNSTFVLAGNALKKSIKVERDPPAKKGLCDRTNTMTRSLNFNDRGPVRGLKPLVGKALPLRRPPAPAPPRSAGFGSSLSRDGTPLQKTVQDQSRLKGNVTEKSVGYKAVRVRERPQAHPYSRPSSYKK